MAFERTKQRLVGAAFVAGPLLLIVSAIVLLADIGRGPGSADYGSSVEGVVGFFGFLLLVPVFLTLASRLGPTHPRLAVAALVASLVGIAGGGLTNMVLRVTTGALVEVGVTAATFDALQADLEAGSTILMWLIWTGPVGPLASILIGIGLLRSGQPRPQAWLMIAAGVFLPMGQLFLIAPDVMYSLALVMWAAALVPEGVQILRDPSGRDL